VPSRLLALTFDAHDPARLAGFWAGVLGREVFDDPRGALLPASDTQLGLRFVHLHLTSTSPGDQQHTVAAALELGASHLDVGQLPEEGHVVLADPEASHVVRHSNHDDDAGRDLLPDQQGQGGRRVGCGAPAG